MSEHVTLSAVEFDPTAYARIRLAEGSQLHNIRRRSNRVATLDGGAVYNDFGFSEQDRTFVVRWRTGNPGADDTVRRMLRQHGKLHLATREALYVVMPVSMETRDDLNTLTLYNIERLTP